MSDKAERKPEAAPAASADKKDAPAKSGGKAGGIGAMLTKTPVMLGGVMLLEAVVLFAGFKFLGSGGPKPAAGAEVATEEHGTAEASASEGSGDGHGGASGAATIDRKKSVEVEVLVFRAPNKLSG